MKVCNIIYSFSPYNCGGADIYAEKISKYLVKFGHESIVITTKPYNGLQSLRPMVEYVDGLKVFRFYPANIYFVGNHTRKNFLERLLWSIIDTYNLHPWRVITYIIKTEKPDIVHLHTPVSISLSVFNSIKRLNIPLIFTLHDYFLLCKRATLLNHRGEICKNPVLPCIFYRWMTKKVTNLNNPDVVISPSKFALDLLRKYSFFKNSRKIILPNGIDVPKKPIKKIDNGIIDIVYIGALSQHKGVHLLVEVFNKLNLKNVRLHIAGKGPMEKFLRRLSRKNNKITFYGWISEKRKKELLRMGDISVLPSLWYENFPTFVLESFSYSIPVIGSNIGGIPELVRDGYNGLLFSVGNVLELKKAILKIALEDSKLRELSSNAYKTAKMYKIDEHVKKLVEIYSSVLSKQSNY